MYGFPISWIGNPKLPQKITVSRKKKIFFQDTRKRIQSSSSYFRKFAQDNIGRNFRRPEPKDEDAKKATEIFRKYSSSSFSNEDEEKEEIISTPGK